MLREQVLGLVEWLDANGGVEVSPRMTLQETGFLKAEQNSYLTIFYKTRTKGFLSFQCTSVTLGFMLGSHQAKFVMPPLFISNSLQTS